MFVTVISYIFSANTCYYWSVTVVTDDSGEAFWEWDLCKWIFFFNKFSCLVNCFPTFCLSHQLPGYSETVLESRVPIFQILWSHFVDGVFQCWLILVSREGRVTVHDHEGYCCWNKHGSMCCQCWIHLCTFIDDM